MYDICMQLEDLEWNGNFMFIFHSIALIPPPSKHLKGQLDPPVSNVTFFGPKEVSWTPP